MPTSRALCPTAGVACIAAFVVMHGCAGRGELPHVEPTEQTVTARLDASYNGSDQYIVVANGSSVEIVVTSVQLRECENIRTSCEVRRLRVRVPPRTEARILTVQPRNRDQAHRFRYGWTWETSRNVAGR